MGGKHRLQLPQAAKRSAGVWGRGKCGAEPGELNKLQQNISRDDWKGSEDKWIDTRVFINTYVFCFQMYVTPSASPTSATGTGMIMGTARENV